MAKTKRHTHKQKRTNITEHADFEDGFSIEDWLDLTPGDQENDLIATSPASLDPTTLPELTKQDKEYLSKCGTAAFVGLPKHVKDDRAMEQFRLRLTLHFLYLRGLSKIIPSSSSFLAAVFGTVQDRDAALIEIRKIRFSHRRLDVDVIAQPFGDVKTRTWTIAGGPMDTPRDVAIALIREFQHSNFASMFQVAEVVTHGYRDGNFAVRFDDPPPFLGKWITINNQKRLVKPQPAQICSFCMGQGHDLWDCDQWDEQELQHAEGKWIIVPPQDDVKSDENEFDDVSTSESEIKTRTGDKRRRSVPGYKRSKTSKDRQRDKD
ncbi:uncharacterized protein N7498_006693 [Penicillium cinerascens]|uniref:Uncharacterized protein n=1 Tax=Penicillium cinerascens TaxID=70096 RepID=A0A9W9MIR8_9EURO|nr:uncharacterized protein N7498_006693 [Penicillium cinerascens]KAJ5202030.1 hypothetical protein N7498_006693 [Penicillium cinerascens]